MESFRSVVFCWMTMIFCLSNIEAKGEDSSTKQLDFAKIDHAQISIEREVYGVFRDGDRLWTLPKFGGFIIESRYNPKGKDSEEAFYMQGRDTAQAKRHQLPESLSDSFWRGIFRLDGRLVVFDSFRRRFLMFDVENKEWSLPRDLVLDLLIPPADSRGEAPSREVASMRARFLRHYKKVASNPEVFTDTAIIPKSWQARIGGSQVMVVSRIPEFSLIGIRCDLSGLGYCQFQQGCFVEAPKKIDQSGFSGIAIDESRQKILVGDYLQQSIHVFQYRSCFQIRYEHSIKLPGQLNAVTALDVDPDGNLWISTEEPDPYRNASVYRWPKGSW